MINNHWMIYGAYGYTGQLIAEEAFRQGHRPLLAGRSAEKLAPVAERFGLDMRVIDLRNKDQLLKALQEVPLVLNAAGPFIHTAQPIVQACLETGTNYLDVSGEALVLEAILSMDRQARRQQMAVIPGVGFNVLASDALVRYVADQVNEPTHLEIATIWLTNGMSPGSFKTMIESYPAGTLARRQGQLIRINARKERRQQRFLSDRHTILPVTLGDVATAYKTTNIPNIITYTVLSEQAANFYSLTEPIFRRLYSLGSLRQLASKVAMLTATPSDNHRPLEATSEAWASVRNGAGDVRQAWLETLESYSFTAIAAVRSVEKLLAEPQVGALTPALAFGADFVLEIPGTRRIERLKDV